MDNLDNIIWVLIAAAMVLLMYAGFTLFESGFVRSKNRVNVAVKNLTGVCISGAMFWAVGYGIMFGISRGGWVGASGFFLQGDLTPWLLSFFLFQLVLAGIATTIISGAVAERMRLSAYVIVALIVSGVLYPVVGHWIWGGLESGTATGWLAQRGFIDFAGATVVHSVGGWIALAAVLIVGPRIGRFSEAKISINGQDLPLAALGVLILWFGWLGFNGGSTLAVTDEIPLIMVNTVLAGAFGGLIALLLSWLLLRQPDVRYIINGILAGLVAISASANIMSFPSAVFIGSIGGLVCVGAMRILLRFKIDDAVGAFPVYAVAGVWGTLAVALFGPLEAWGTGFSRVQQLQVQALGAGAVFVWAFGVGFLLLSLVNIVFHLRVNAEDEHIGLNIAEHSITSEYYELGVEATS